jgi:transposase
MPGVLTAHQAYKQADEDALAMRARARARLGREILDARAQGTSQESIARRLGVTREQVRRYQQAYRDWVRDNPGEELT